jgi:alkanesulfonate monooxygenase SsuD/methylene tetrahydromethanopterin reductase-like flavin-dependent oxidoreductase (luciferase family)
MSIDFGGGIVLIWLPPVVLTAALATLDAIQPFRLLGKGLCLH